MGHFNVFIMCLLAVHTYATSFREIDSSITIDDYTTIKPSLGAVFSKVGEIDPSIAAWTHTFVIPKFQRWDYMLSRETCNRLAFNNKNIRISKELCVQFAGIMGKYEEFQDHLLRTIEGLSADFEQALPEETEAIDDTDNRNKRAWIPYIDTIAKKVLGVARHKDLVQLGKVVNHLGGRMFQAHEKLTQQLDNMHSYQVTTNSRINHIKQALLQVRSDLGNMRKSVLIWEKQLIRQLDNTTKHLVTETIHLKQFMASLHRYNIQHLSIITDILLQNNNKLSAAQDLLKGYLPIHLVRPRLLNNTLEKVRGLLRQSLPNYQITHRNTGYYYNHRITSFIHTEKYLFVKINIPISPIGQKLFDVFKIDILPVPVYTTNHTGLTEVDTKDIEYLGISKDKAFYIELDTKTYSHCAGNKVKRCKDIMMPRGREELSCISAIYFESHKEIHDKCKIMFRPKVRGNFFKVLSLSNGRYIISASPQKVLLSCPDKPARKLRTKVLSLIQLDCGCQLEGEQFAIPPTFHGCANDSSQIFPLNLAFFHKFYSDQYHLNFSTHPRHGPPTFEWPSLEIVSSNLDNIMTKDEQIKYDLDQLAQSYEKHKQVFATKEDYLIHELKWLLAPETKNSALVVAIIVGTCIIAGGIAIVILYCKLRGIGRILLSIAALANPANGQFIYTLTPPSTNSNSTTNYWDRLVYVALAMLLVVITKRIYKMCKKVIKGQAPPDGMITRVTTHLYFHIHHKMKYGFIPIAIIPHHIGKVRKIKDIGLTKEHLETKLSCTGMYIRVDWSFLKLKIDNYREFYGLKTLVLPEYVKVPMMLISLTRTCLKPDSDSSIQLILYGDGMTLPVGSMSDNGAPTAVVGVQPFRDRPRPLDRRHYETEDDTDDPDNPER